MSYCNNCKLKIKTKKNICPLCFNELNNDNENYYGEYPSYEWFYKIQKNINTHKIVLLSSLTAIIILIIVNITTNFKFNWAVISISGIMAGYCTFSCFTAKTLYLRQKLLVEFFIISPLIIIVDVFTGFYEWSFNYAIPFLSIALNIAMLFISLLDYKYFSEYVSYIISASFTSIFMLIIPLFGFILWSSLSAFGSAIIILLTMLIFFNRDFILSIKKIFHL